MAVSLFSRMPRLVGVRSALRVVHRMDEGAKATGSLRGLRPVEDATRLPRSRVTREKSGKESSMIPCGEAGLSGEKGTQQL